MRYGQYVLSVNPTHSGGTLPVHIEFTATTKFYVTSIFRTLYFPHIAITQPVIRLFDLRTILNFLPEHTVLIANTVTNYRQIEGCAAVKEARSQTTQTTITEAGVSFFVGNVFQFHTVFVQRGFNRLLQIKI